MPATVLTIAAILCAAFGGPLWASLLLGGLALGTLLAELMDSA